VTLADPAFANPLLVHMHALLTVCGAQVPTTGDAIREQILDAVLDRERARWAATFPAGVPTGGARTRQQAVTVATLLAPPTEIAAGHAMTIIDEFAPDAAAGARAVTGIRAAASTARSRRTSWPCRGAPGASGQDRRGSGAAPVRGRPAGEAVEPAAGQPGAARPVSRRAGPSCRAGDDLPGPLPPRAGRAVPRAAGSGAAHPPSAAPAAPPCGPAAAERDHRHDHDRSAPCRGGWAQRAGHWEGGLITGASNRSAIGTLVDRASRYTMLLHLPGRHTAEAVRDALIAAFSHLPPRLRRSLTWDQGKEMALHAEVTAALGMPVYFCEKASPWQRPSNENTNGLLRQYFPKGSDLRADSAGGCRAPVADAASSHRTDRPNPAAPRVPASPARTGRDRNALGYLWAMHPATAGNGVHHVQAVSSRAILSHRRAAPGPYCTARFTTMPGTRKALSLVGKGP
jgi:hypothetical protein